MALLTADDVLNKKFQPTKFREGYDQDEVDDFLDEVVNTLRAVYAENEELKARLASGAPAAEAAPVVDQAPAEEQATQVFSEVAPEPEVPAEPEVEEAPTPAEQAPAQFAQPTPQGEPESATGMLQLAQRLHDEYVNDGKAEADRLLTAAREESERLTSEAEEMRTNTLNQLETERDTLERKIDELRGFERDYRARLKSYLEGLLRDVDGPAAESDALGGSTPGGFGLN